MGDYNIDHRKFSNFMIKNDLLLSMMGSEEHSNAAVKPVMTCVLFLEKG